MQLASLLDASTLALGMVIFNFFFFLSLEPHWITDFAVLNHHADGSFNFSIFLNQGNGYFNTDESASYVLPAMPGASAKIASGDLTGDGASDIVVYMGNFTTAYIYVFPLITGTSTFNPTPSASFSLPSRPQKDSAPYDLFVEDVNGDFVLDIVGVYFDGFSVLLNLGGLSFSNSPYTYTGIRTFAIADVNNDAKADLVFQNLESINYQIVTILNNGTGGFNVAAPVKSSVPTACQLQLDIPPGIGLIDSDTIVDVIFVCGSTGDVYFGPGQNNGAFGGIFTLLTSYGSTGGSLSAIIVKDLTADGKADVVIGTTLAGLYAWVGFRNSSLSNEYINQGIGTRAILFANIDNPGPQADLEQVSNP